MKSHIVLFLTVNSIVFADHKITIKSINNLSTSKIQINKHDLYQYKGKVDFTISAEGSDSVWVSLIVSRDKGKSYPIIPSVSGDNGYIKNYSGTKTMGFQFTSSVPFKNNFKVKIIASDDNFSEGKHEIIRFLIAHRKADGRFGPLYGICSHKNWNFEAAYALRFLGASLQNEETIGIASGLSLSMESAMDFEAKLLPNMIPAYWSENEPLTIATVPKYFGTSGHVSPGASGMREIQWAAHLAARRGRPIEENKIINWVKHCRMEDGGYTAVPNGFTGNNSDWRTYMANYNGDPAPPSTSESKLKGRGQLTETYHALQLMRERDSSIPAKEATEAFVKACQFPEGGFGYAPTTSSLDYGNKQDMWYTWCAIKALDILGARPNNVPGVIAWVESCHNIDGGYGDRPGWKSRIQTTMYAAEILKILKVSPAKGTTIPETSNPIPPNFKVYRAQFDVVHSVDVDQWVIDELNKKSSTDLIGARGSFFPPDSLRSQLKTNASFIIGNEVQSRMAFSSRIRFQWSHWLTIYAPVPGKTGRGNVGYIYENGTTIADDWFKFWFEPAGPASVVEGAFNKTKSLNGLAYSEEHKRDFAYQMHDIGAPNAMIAQGHDQPKDFAGQPNSPNDQTFVERFAGREPLISYIDAHAGNPEWYINKNEYSRTMFLGPDNSWNSFMEAARNGHTAFVSKVYGVDDWTYTRSSEAKVYPTLTTEGDPIYAFGYPEVLDFIDFNRKQWQWW